MADPTNSFGDPSSGGGGFLGGVGNWLQDPNNQRLLAGIGTAINPSPGNVAAQKAVDMLARGKASQGAADAQQSSDKGFVQSAISALGKIFSGPKSPGITKIEGDDKGGVSITGTPEIPPGQETVPAAAPTTAPTPTVPTKAPTVASPTTVVPTSATGIEPGTGDSTAGNIPAGLGRRGAASSQLSNMLPFY